VGSWVGAEVEGVGCDGRPRVARALAPAAPCIFALSFTRDDGPQNMHPYFTCPNPSTPLSPPPFIGRGPLITGSTLFYREQLRALSRRAMPLWPSRHGATRIPTSKSRARPGLARTPSILRSPTASAAQVTLPSSCTTPATTQPSSPGSWSPKAYARPSVMQVGRVITPHSHCF
jgi:hypothetical protein